MSTFEEALREAGESTPARRYRFLIVNEHYLGHVTVHRLICKALAADPAVDFDPERDTIRLDTVDDFTERVERKLVSLRFPNRWVQQQDLDLARWRFQRFVANLARKRAIQKLSEHAYDALMFNSQTAALASLDIMRRYPSLVSTDITNRQAAAEWNLPATRWTYWPSMFWERKVFRAAGIVAPFSEWARQAILAENRGIDPEKVRTMPVGAELAPFLEMHLARPAREKTRLLFVGGDFERKGGADLLAAFEESLHPSCELHIVSNGAPEKLPEGVTVYRNIAPYSPELLEQYRQADIFALPTRNEAYGHVFIEAMAAGLPVIATHINAIPEILPEENRPYLIAPGDREALTTAVLAFRADPSLRQKLGQAGRERARSQFDANVCAARTVAWLKELADAAWTQKKRPWGLNREFG